MLSQMGSRVFQEWQAYYSAEPFGEYRSELRHGQHLALLANLNRDEKKKPEPFKPIDFMNFIDRPEEPELTPEEYFAKIDREVFGL